MRRKLRKVSKKAEQSEEVEPESRLEAEECEPESRLLAAEEVEPESRLRELLLSRLWAELLCS